MTDTDKAVHVCAEYLAWRPGIRTRLLAQVDDGMKAQNLEGDLQAQLAALLVERDALRAEVERLREWLNEIAQ